MVAQCAIIFKIPLIPPFSKGEVPFPPPLFGKEGLEEIRMSTWIIELELMRLY
jgi:hypothetical protein